MLTLICSKMLQTKRNGPKQKRGPSGHSARVHASSSMSASAYKPEISTPVINMEPASGQRGSVTVLASPPITSGMGELYSAFNFDWNCLS